MRKRQVAFAYLCFLSDEGSQELKQFLNKSIYSSKVWIFNIKNQSAHWKNYIFVIYENKYLNLEFIIL